MIYKTVSIKELELLYSILKNKYPDKVFNIVFDYTTKIYTLALTPKNNNNLDKTQVIPIDLKVEVIYGDTDSVFISYKYNLDNYTQNRHNTFRLSQICSDIITKKVFDRPPIELEFEKVFQPFILLTKKRYIGNKYENLDDPMKLSKIDYKGIAILRRDFCPFVKECYSKIIDIIFQKTNINSEQAILDTITLYREYITNIENYNIQFSQLILTSLINKEYSCKLCKKKCEWILKCKCGEINKEKNTVCRKCNRTFECLHTFSLAHINLAQKMLQRKEDINIGDRIAFIYIQDLTDDNNLAKNELSENLEYVTKHNLKFNRICYAEQLMKTILSFYKVLLKDKTELLDDIIAYSNKKLISFGGTKLKASDYKLFTE
jgi:DNA polymerase elongation subunit (family B)